MPKYPNFLTKLNKFLPTLFFVVIMLPAFSVNQLDSLKSNFEHRLNKYNLEKGNLSFTFLDLSLSEDNLIQYLEFLDEINNSSNLNESQKLLVLFEKGSIYYQLNNRDSAISYFNNAERLINKSKNPEAYINFNIEASKASLDFIYDEDAVLFLENIIEMPELQLDIHKYFNALLDIASLYFSQHIYHLSIHYCDLAYPLIDQLEYKTQAVNLLILMYRNSYWSDNDSANYEYLEEAHLQANLSDDPYYLSQVLYYEGLALRRMGRHEEGIKILLESRENSLKAGNKEDIGVLIYIALAYQQLNDSEQMCYWADYLLEKALEQNKMYNLANVYLSQAECKISLGENKEAKILIEKALESRKLYWNSESSPGYYYHVHEAYRDIGEFESALKYLDLSHSQTTKALQSENSAQLGQQRAKFDYLIQKEKIASLSAENKIKQEREKRFIILALAISFILLISWFFTFLLRKQNLNLKLSHQKIVKKYLELDKLQDSMRKIEPKKQNGNLLKNETEIKQIIIDLFEIDKVFKEPDFSLSMLAKILNTNTSYLSATINQTFEMNFKSLVNKYRIDEARKLLTSDTFQNYSMEGIAKESGFQSRSSFHQLFKKETGMSPAIFADNYKNVIESIQG